MAWARMNGRQESYHITAKSRHYIMALGGTGWHWMALDGTGWQGGHEQGVRILVAELEID
jgi:hypothetical protein